MMEVEKGIAMYNLAKKLFPICRSITGEGFRKSLEIIRGIVPEITVQDVPTGTSVFDWTVPREWNIRGGGIYRLNGDKVIDFEDTNLHIMGYSIPINKVVRREELLEHIYTQPDQPDWIPYVTSYYKERWGFCMSENQKKLLDDDEYKVVIDSSLEDGFLSYGELIVPGQSKEEVLFSTYLCHPSMANNELSGPVLQTELIKYIKGLDKRRYTYRFVFIPETIGSITYLSRNLNYLQKHIIAGYVLSCVGDDRTYSMISTKYSNTLADRVLKNVLLYHYPKYVHYSYLQRGSDERQYNSVGVDLPVCGFCRSKHGEYPEYHTSADNLSLISPNGLFGSYQVMTKVIDALEHNYKFILNCKCEPQLGKRGLYPTTSQKGNYEGLSAIKNFIAYADGTNDLIQISSLINEPIDTLIKVSSELLSRQLISIVE